MQTTFIATTPRSSLEPLRHQGIVVSENHAQLQSMLRNNLSPEHALLFAEPVADASDTSVDWYTSLEGTVQPLSSLPPEEQQMVVQEIHRLAADIQEYAQRLKDEGEGPRAMRGNILSLALQYPGPEYVYVVGRQPLVLGWGFSPASLAAGPEDILRINVVAPPIKAKPASPVALVPPPPPPVQRTRSGVFLPLLMGLLLALGLILLAGLLFGRSGCPYEGVTLPGGCTIPSLSPQSSGGDTPPPALSPELITALTAEQEKERSLRKQLENLRAQLAGRANECPRPVPSPPPAPEPEPKPEPAPEPEAPPSLADMLPTTPEAPPEPESPPPPPAPKRVAKGDTLEIPDNARKENDLSFLEGCWICETGLVSSTTGEPVTVRYCFGKDGKGERTVTARKRGDTCKGPITAKFGSGGALSIHAGAARCKRGGFVPSTVTCQQKGKKAECRGKDGNNRWNATFRRM